jgi:hypothetical protein
MLRINNKLKKRSSNLSGVNEVALHCFYNGQCGLFDAQPSNSSTRPVKERKSIQKWAESVQWMGLFILNTDAGEASDEIGFN